VDVAGSEENVVDDEEDVSCEIERVEVGVSNEEVKVVESDETLSSLDFGCWFAFGACCDGESSAPLVVGSVLSGMIGDASSLAC
jgi:hypothetical protein